MRPTGSQDRAAVAAAHRGREAAVHRGQEAAAHRGQEAVVLREVPADDHPKVASVDALPCGAAGHREVGRRGDPGAWAAPPKADAHPEAAREDPGVGPEGREARGNHPGHPWGDPEEAHRDRAGVVRQAAVPGDARPEAPRGAPCREAGAVDHQGEAAAGTRAVRPAVAPNRRGRAPEPGTCADARTASSPR